MFLFNILDSVEWAVAQFEIDSVSQKEVDELN